MNKTIITALVAVAAISIIGIDQAYGFASTFRNTYDQDVQTSISTENGKSTFHWDLARYSDFPNADVRVMGKILTLTAEDIRKNDTRFENHNHIETDVSHLVFSAYGHKYCVYVGEDYDEDNTFDALRVVCGD